MGAIQSVCVYCGSNFGEDPAFTQAANALGRQLAEQNITLVYGGGNVGLMGEAARAAMAAGGRVVGVIPQHLLDLEVGKRDVSELIVVQTMHERKAKMAELADAFVALPGGVGTLEEIIEISVWSQLALHAKPSTLLNVSGYYNKLIEFLDHMVTQRFLKPEQRSILTAVTSVDAVLPKLREGAPEAHLKWLAKP
jgi:uncharacterized protein (TIGR00730 family)